MPEHEIELYKLLMLIAIPGALGGFCTGIHDIIVDGFDYGKKLNRNYKKIIITLIGKVIIGAICAFASFLFVFWLAKVSTIEKMDNIITIICVSILGGIISFKALPQISEKFRKELLMAKEEVQEIKEKQGQSYKKMEINDVLGTAETAFGTMHPADLKKARDQLLDLTDKNPTHRKLHIYLGRINFESGELDQAIIVLRQFISNLDIFNADKSERDPHYYVDKADALYNIACYFSLKAKETHQANKPSEDVNRLLEESLVALTPAIKYNPENKEFSTDDSDFDFLKGHQEFGKRFSELTDLKNGKSN